MVSNFVNPDLYHGWHKRSNFFEGWYFKLVDASAQQVFVFIPGIHLTKNQKDTHSFIQVLKGKEVNYRYLRFSSDEFITSRGNFHVSISDNYFSLEQIYLNIADANLNIKGKVNLKNILKWPDTLWNPGSMVFYNFIPNMQCYSQVCVMDMDLEGHLSIDGKEIDFTHGKGYKEKNWGKAFPSKYHFNDPISICFCLM